MEICFKCGIGIGNTLKSPIYEICKYCYVPEPVVVKPKPKKVKKPKPKYKYKSCAVCSKEFKPTSNRQIVCSVECKAERTKLHHRNYHIRSYKPVERVHFKTLSCVVCGSNFIGRYNSKLCGAECKNIRKKQSQTKYKSKIRNEKC